jgi:hypothetical protein
MASNDPEFEEKAAAIIGLYLNPPQNAAVFCVDEKSAIKLWTGWIAGCPYPQAGLRSMDSNTIATARCPCTRH